MIQDSAALAEHKHVRDQTGLIRCVQIHIEGGVQRAFIDSNVLHELEVAHAPTALRFCRKTMNDAYPGGAWIEGICPEHPVAELVSTTRR